jgi:hypothetical protein
LFPALRIGNIVNTGERGFTLPELLLRDPIHPSEKNV